MRFNASAAASLYAELAALVIPARRLSGDPTADTNEFIGWLEQLITELQLPDTLRLMDIAESDLPMLARDAMLQQRLLINNPCEVTEKDALEIYQAAW